MNENEHFILIIEKLKELGLLQTDKELADKLNIKKTSLSDIRYNRKGVSIEILRNIKKSYPLINLNWIIMGEGKMFSSDHLSDIQAEYQTNCPAGTGCTLCQEKNKRLIAQEKLIKSLERLLKI